MIRRPPRSTLFPSPPLSRSLAPARPDADPPRRGALLDRRAGVDREALRRGPRELQEDRRAPPELALRVARALSDRRSEEHTSELQSQSNLVCRLLLEKKKKK